jgi:hypothetical protein
VRDVDAVALAVGAPAVWGVEGEEAGVEFFEGASGARAVEVGGEDGGGTGGVEGDESAVAVTEGGGDECGGVGGFGARGDVADVGFDGVFFEAFEGFEFVGFDPFAVDAQEGDGVACGPAGDFGVVAFAGLDEGGEELECFFAGEAGDGGGNVGFGLADGGFAGVGVVLGAAFGPEEAHEVVDFGDGADGAFAAATGGVLFDGNGGGDAGGGVHVGFFHLGDELTGVGVEAVEVAALAFGEDDVEGEGGFAGAAEAGDDGPGVEGDVDVDVFEVVVACAADLDGGGRRRGGGGGRCGQRQVWGVAKGSVVGSGGRSGEGGVALECFFEEGAGGGCGVVGDLLWCALGAEAAAAVAGFGAEVEDVVGVFDDVEVVFDDDEGVAGVDELVECFYECGDVVEVEAGGGFVEDEEVAGGGDFFAGAGFAARGGRDEVFDEFEALAFAAGELAEGLAEGEVAQADAFEEFECGGDVCGEFLFAGGSGLGGASGEEGAGGGDVGVEDVVHAEAVVSDLEDVWFEAFAEADRAGEVEVGEELHFDFFVAHAVAAVAAAVAGVEGEVGGVEAGGAGVFCGGEEFADGVPCADVEDGVGARGAGKWGLVNELDVAQVVGTLE